MVITHTHSQTVLHSPTNICLSGNTLRWTQCDVKCAELNRKLSVLYKQSPAVTRLKSYSLISLRWSRSPQNNTRGQSRISLRADLWRWPCLIRWRRTVWWLLLRLRRWWATAGIPESLSIHCQKTHTQHKSAPRLYNYKTDSSEIRYQNIIKGVEKLHNSLLAGLGSSAALFPTAA